MTAIGQGKTQVSPYHMALLASGIANGGIIMEPYLVDRVESYTGAKIEKTMPKKYTEIMNSKEAAQLKEYMRAVVEEGTARALQNDDYTVAGKTGTAEQTKSRPSHALFVGYAPYETPEIAIATRIPFGYSSDYAAQATRDIVKYYYGLAEEEELITGVADTPDGGISNEL